MRRWWMQIGIYRKLTRSKVKVKLLVSHLENGFAACCTRHPLDQHGPQVGLPKPSTIHLISKLAYLGQR